MTLKEFISDYLMADTENEPRLFDQNGKHITRLSVRMYEHYKEHKVIGIGIMTPCHKDVIDHTAMAIYLDVSNPPLS